MNLPIWITHPDVPLSIWHLPPHRSFVEIVYRGDPRQPRVIHYLQVRRQLVLQVCERYELRDQRVGPDHISDCLECALNVGEIVLKPERRSAAASIVGLALNISEISDPRMVPVSRAGRLASPAGMNMRANVPPSRLVGAESTHVP
jgi:hypothetical protein